MKKNIFLITGSTYPFDRLTQQIDEINKNKKYNIFAQIGESEYIPKNIKFAKFLEYEEITTQIKKSDIVITHAGVGTIIDVLAQNKKLILFPRLKKYNEAIDDHQIEICKAFENKFRINWTKDANEIEKLINKTNTIKKTKKESKLVKEITKIIQ